MDHVLGLAEAYGPVGILLILTLCSFGFPMAKSLLVAAAGILAGAGRGNPVLLFLSCCLGLHGGDFLQYLIGRRWGEAVLEHSWVQRFAPPAHVHRARLMIERYGLASLLLARITPFVRGICYLLLGTLRLNIALFTLANLAIAAAYAAVFFSMGLAIGNNPERLMDLYRSGHLAFAAVVLALVAALVYRRFRMRT